MISVGDPGDLDVLHTCDTPLCVEPTHIYAGTHQQNMQDSVNRGRNWNVKKTHCKRGHPLSDDNLRINPRGERVCKTCACLLTRAYMDRKRARLADREEKDSDGSATVPA